MKFGYMPGREYLVEEIEFAKQYFDFLELTFPPIHQKLSELKPIMSDQKLQTLLKTTINNFPTLGHLFWFDFTRKSKEQSEVISASIKTFNALGIKFVTMHPSGSQVKANIKYLVEVNNMCQVYGITLSIENTPNEPFCNPDAIISLLKALPNTTVTFDMGHTNRISEKATKIFISQLKDKIRHIHMHHNIGQADHIPYDNLEQVKADLQHLKQINYSGTVTLEMFLPNIDGKIQDHNIEGRHKLLLQQLDLVKQAT